MEKKNHELMEEIKVKLEDIHNSQASLIEKIAHVLVELYNLPDADLEKGLNQVHSNTSDNTDITHKLIEDYEMKINREKNK